jgi:hypothetical protein
MRNGEYPGAGPNHYPVGSYQEDGNDVQISITVTQCGALSTIFGQKSSRKLQVTSKGKIEKVKLSAQAGQKVSRSSTLCCALPGLAISSNRQSDNRLADALALLDKIENLPGAG